MDIYEFAMQMEQDGEKLYRDLAQRSADPGVRRIFSMLADDEVKHYDVVKTMKAAAPVQMLETQVLATAKNVFEQMQGQAIDLSGTQIELYRQAQEIERKSREFYQEKAEEVSGPGHKQLLIRIADEENRHYFLLDHMIEFVSRPQTWIEDAEFNHLDQY